LFGLLGAVVGLAGTAFIRGLSFAEDVFEEIENPYLRNIIGMLMLGNLCADAVCPPLLRRGCRLFHDPGDPQR
jgi:H+/Cl- antiporter ClcA